MAVLLDPSHTSSLAVSCNVSLSETFEALDDPSPDAFPDVFPLLLRLLVFFSLSLELTKVGTGSRCPQLWFTRLRRAHRCCNASGPLGLRVQQVVGDLVAHLLVSSVALIMFDSNEFFRVTFGLMTISNAVMLLTVSNLV